MSDGAEGRLPGSFRDPAGFVFRRDGSFFRQVNRSYQATFATLMRSGLYATLVDRELLIAHEDADPGLGPEPDAVAVLRPEQLEFVSYPFEWSFSQLKASALTTLRVQRLALAHGLSLKDASAYNVQLHRGRPVLIDTLSFEPYEPGLPWVGYRQFCQHFLAPLALMAFRDIRLGTLLQRHLDGLPLDLAAGLLPWRTRLRPGLLMHLHLHSRAQARYADSDRTRASLAGRMSRRRLDALLESLESTVRRLSWNPAGTPWASYGDQSSYSDAAFADKERLVTEYAAQAATTSVWDIGGNVGVFSRIAAASGASVVSIDSDSGAVDLNYRQMAESGERNLFPIVADLTSPSPALGWDNCEVTALTERGPAGLLMALALVHHLAIGNNTRFERLAQFFAKLGRRLLIEFVPPDDPMAVRLLTMRNHTFPWYTQQEFEATFDRWFQIQRSDRIADSNRHLYLMRAM
ncbi:MAG: class I SAM-dependent methyltransferase [Chloroflexota bacterium]|nr:class I SAM-dependent methyltransferase [Chloroflexota bacterium]MDE2899368.1 class I SAM-dependent methyltransferase [Chloroflexota bacterium]